MLCDNLRALSIIYLLFGFALLLAGTGNVEAAVVFSDDFSSNNGWTLTNTWEIGPASASSGHNIGNPDPSTDFTPSIDNGVLGANIGGNIGAPDGGTHDFWWATSPVINAGLLENAELNFYRWLNSDYDPYMTSRVDVWDGSSWQTIWETAGNGTNPLDNAWTSQTFDISAFADGNSEFQVRFGWDVTQGGVFNVSGWNIDDISVSGDAVPEPTTIALWSVLGIGVVTYRRWRKRHRQSGVVR